MNLKSFVFTLAHSLKWHPERCLTFSNMVIGLIDQGNVQPLDSYRLYDSPLSFMDESEDLYFLNSVKTTLRESIASENALLGNCFQ